MFNLASENKFRKDGNHNTRAMDTYVFDTDIVRLGIYSNSPYYKGVNLWNGLPVDIKSIHDKQIFNQRTKRHFQITINT